MKRALVAGVRVVWDLFGTLQNIQQLFVATHRVPFLLILTKLVEKTLFGELIPFDVVVKQ